jgi:vitamin B12 transporter
VCGWHRRRSNSAPLCVALFGAVLVAAGPRTGVGAELLPAHAATDDEDEEPDVTIEVVDSARSPGARAARRPESAFSVAVDGRVSPTATVADALQRVPGASIRRTGGPLDPAFVTVRGASSQQVAVFVDGVPLNNFGAAAVDLSELPLSAFSRVELYRGFAPPHLGGFAIGGAVDLVSDPHRAPAPRLEVSWGSFQTRRVVLSGARPLPRRAGFVRAHVAYTGTRGDFPAFSNQGTLYSTADDTTSPRANNHRDQVTGWLSLAANAGPVELRLLELPTWSDGGEPGAWHAQAREARSGTVQNLLHGRARIRLAPTASLRVGLGWRVRADSYEDRLGEVGVGNQDQRNLIHAIDGDISALLQPRPWLEVRPSVRLHGLAHRTTEHLPVTSRGPVHGRFGAQLALDARLLAPSDRLEVRGAIGALLVKDATSGKPDGASLVEVLPGFAVAAHPAPFVTVRASIARAARAPTFLELFGDRGSVVGNPGLRPERATQVDGGVTAHIGDDPTLRGSVEVGGYLRDTVDLIVIVPNSARVGVPQNLGRALVAGIESHAAVKAGWLEGSFALTANLGSRILDGEAGTVGNRVPHVPLWQAVANVALVVRELVRVQWSFVGLGGTYDSPSNFFEQAPRALHDLHLRVQPHPRSPWVAVDVRNLLDVHTGLAYRNPLAPDPDDVAPVPLQDFRGQPLPGRSFMLTIGWSPGAPR